jgi:hypothetical protein
MTSTASMVSPLPSRTTRESCSHTVISYVIGSSRDPNDTINSYFDPTPGGPSSMRREDDAGIPTLGVGEVSGERKHLGDRTGDVSDLVQSHNGQFVPSGRFGLGHLFPSLHGF